MSARLPKADAPTPHTAFTLIVFVNARPASRRVGLLNHDQPPSGLFLTILELSHIPAPHALTAIKAANPNAAPFPTSPRLLISP